MNLSKLKLIIKKQIFRVLSVQAYKDEDGRWYVKDSNGFSKSENELVAGVPELIESLAPGSKLVKIKYSESIFTGSQRVLTSESENAAGATYSYVHNLVEHKIWLCSVFFWYFKSAPFMLFVQIRRQK